MLSPGTIYLFCVYSMIGLPEEALAIAFSRSMLTFRYRGYVFQKEKMFLFLVEIYVSLKGCQCYLVKVNKQTKNKHDTPGLKEDTSKFS